MVGYKSITFCGHPDLCKNFLRISIGNFEPELETALQDADVVMALRFKMRDYQKNLPLALMIMSRDIKLMLTHFK